MHITPLSSVSITKDFVSLYQKVHDDVRLSEKNTPYRVLNLRPSQMPFCVREFFIDHATSGLFRTQDMAGAFYTSVGHVVHSVVQNYLCRTGRFLADYHCRECGTWHKLTYVHECCDFPCEYHEVEIDYKGIKGHIDALYKDRKGRLWILDFKTTSVKSAPVKKRNPGSAYVEQIETYAVLFELQYKMRIEGIMDAFILRDNPRKDPTVFSKTLTDERRRVIKTRLRLYKKMHRETIDAETWPQVRALLEYPRCDNSLCKVCKSDDQVILNKMKAAYKAGIARENLPIRAMAERGIPKRRRVAV